MTLVTPELVATARRRTRAVLVSGQILAGLGMGSTLSVGALLAASLSGSSAFSGMAATMSTLGAAAAAIPLATLAGKRGRSPALATGALGAALGALFCIVAAVVAFFPLLLLGLALVGVGTAVNLQSRFAATDLSLPNSRGRDLSIVVWATTIGAVSGPNLIAPGDDLGVALGLPPLSGAFLFTIAAQALAAILYLVGLQPDPLVIATELGRTAPVVPGAVTAMGNPIGVRVGMVSISLSHATMVAVMAMTPVHLTDHGATLAVVGFTISLHVGGMYALAPVFGVLSDRLGRVPTILTGQALLAASLCMTSLGAESESWVMTGLIFLGLGWSASTVAGSALIAASADPSTRTRTQGRADLLMSGSGALGGALAGVVLAMLGYGGLSTVALVLVVVVVATLVPNRRRI
ncbi:MAG: major facilitator superfamily 1 [Microbacteriaceae bacterium]|nr:major facilitator superfamily 1 [Microbacteriaceae bacterium]